MECIHLAESSKMDTFQTISWEEIMLESKLDEEAQEILQCIRFGFPVRREDANECIKTHWQFRQEL